MHAPHAGCSGEGWPGSWGHHRCCQHPGAHPVESIRTARILHLQPRVSARLWSTTTRGAHEDRFLGRIHNSEPFAFSFLCSTESLYSTFSICINPTTASIVTCPGKLLSPPKGCKEPLNWTKGKPVRNITLLALHAIGQAQAVQVAWSGMCPALSEITSTDDLACCLQVSEKCTKYYPNTYP